MPRFARAEHVHDALDVVCQFWVTTRDEVVGAVAVIVKLVVAIVPSLTVSLAGLNVHVNPTGRPVHA
jgi:hypothetical protein